MAATDDAAATDRAPAPRDGAVWPLDRVVSLVVDGAVAACSATELRVLVVLVAYADVATGVAWPSRATIASRAGVSVRSVTRALDALLAAGWISAERRSGGRTVSRYRVVPGARPMSLGELVASDPQPGHRDGPVRDQQPGHASVPVGPPEPGHSATATGTSRTTTGTLAWPTTVQTVQTVHPPTPHDADQRAAEVAAIRGALGELRIRREIDVEWLVGEGLDRDALAELATLARRKATRSPAGLLADWLTHATRWRDQLGEAHHRRARRRGRAAVTGDTATDPVAIADLAGQPETALAAPRNPPDPSDGTPGSPPERQHVGSGGDDGADPSGGFAGELEQRRAVIDRLREHGVAHRNGIRAAMCVDAAVRDGLGVDDVERLVAAARASGEPIAVIWSWLAGDGWREVLRAADAEVAGV